MDQNACDTLRERLLAAPYRVIDFLPRQVPPESGGSYFAVERYLMAHPQIDELYARFARLLVKLSCYYSFTVYDPQSDTWRDAPAPEELAALVKACAAAGPDRYLQILLPGEDALLAQNGEDLYMTLYHPGDELRETAAQLAAAEGLFLRTSAPDQA